jgi:cold shock CspA family protein
LVIQLRMSSTRVTGQVKWFNTKAGYGFITGCGGDYKEKDIFVHYSSVKVVNSQYRYLVQGEYVEFDVVKPEGDKHEHHAVNVTGINGGSIMCESRRTYPTTERPRPVRRYRTQRPSSANGNRGDAPDNRGSSEVRPESSASARDSADAPAEADGFKKVTRGRPRRAQAPKKE